MLIHELEAQGNWLFKYRSYVPLVLLPFAVLAVSELGGYLGESATIEVINEIGCFLISLSGLAVRGMAIGYALPGTSGRNTEGQIAEHLNTKGIYSVIRHPLYLGNMLMMLGILLSTRSLLLTISGMLFYLLFYERIIAAEEAFLLNKFGETFRQWAARTPALWPRRAKWQDPELRFSWRAAIKGEFYGFTATVTVMMLMNALKTGFFESRFGVNLIWLGLFAVSILLFFILRHLRKHTRFFE
jgi:protein-S-isoprenylcysteine O-methyltransferase Ste14